METTTPVVRSTMVPLPSTPISSAPTRSNTSVNFQTSGFYQKLGYEGFTMLEDHPWNHRNYYLRKRLE
jgi:hypothetical protein